MLRLLCTLLFVIGATASEAALPSVKELGSVLQPFRVDRMALAPDGRHIAYTVRSGSELTIMLVDVDDPRKRASIDTERYRDDGAFRLSFFGWGSADCLVFGVRRPFAEDLYAVDAGGREVRKLVDGQEFGIDFDPNVLATSQDAALGSEDRKPISKLPRNPRALGFSNEKPGIIMVETTGPGIPASPDAAHTGVQIETELYEVDMATGRKTSVFSGTFEGRVIYDRQYRPRLVHVQTTTEAVQSFALPSSSFWKNTDSFEKAMDQKTAASFTWTPETFFGPRSIPLAFDKDPEILYYASNEGRDTFGLYAYNLKSKKRTSFSFENNAVDFVSPGVPPGSGATLVFDRYTGNLVGVRTLELEASTRWVDKELADIQTILENKLPRRIVRILDWDETRSRILAASSSTDDPGRFFVFDRKNDSLIQFARRAPWVDLDEVNLTDSFSVATKQGLQLTGYITRPREALLNPPPLLVYLHDAPWSRALPGFNTEVQALARMGFIVVQVNYRGSGGFGFKHCMAMKGRLDEVPLEDVRAVIHELGKNITFDRKRVVLFGNGFGGFLALRALELFPGEFRCAIAINAPLDLADSMDNHLVSARNAQAMLGMAQRMNDYIKQVNMPIDLENPRPRPRMPSSPVRNVNFMDETKMAFFGDGAELTKISALHNVDKLSEPVLIIQREDDPYLRFEHAVALRKKAESRGIPVEVVKLDPAYRSGDVGARAKVFGQILEFLNANIYKYDVKVGPVEVRK